MGWFLPRCQTTGALLSHDVFYWLCPGRAIAGVALAAASVDGAIIRYMTPDERAADGVIYAALTADLLLTPEDRADNANIPHHVQVMWRAAGARVLARRSHSPL